MRIAAAWVVKVSNAETLSVALAGAACGSIQKLTQDMATIMLDGI